MIFLNRPSPGPGGEAGARRRRLTLPFPLRARLSVLSAFCWAPSRSCASARELRVMLL